MQFPLTMAMLLLMVFASCKKQNRETTIEGRVVESYAQRNIAYADVYLMEADDTEGKNAHSIEKKTSDAEGKFMFTFKPGKNKAYALKFMKGCFNHTSAFIERKENNYQHTYRVAGSGRLFIAVKNTSPFDANDQFNFSLNKNATAGEYPAFSGTSVDYLIHSTYVTENEKIYIKSFVTKNGISTVKLDSIVPITCDNLTFNLNY